MYLEMEVCGLILGDKTTHENLKKRLNHRAKDRYGV